MAAPYASMRSMISSSRYQSSLDSERFPSPWLDMASLAMPDNIRDTWDMCEYLFDSQGTIRQAYERILAYFLTDVEIGSAGDQVGDDEKDKWRDLLTDTLPIKLIEQQLDRDFACYGNAYGHFVVPFVRFLFCPRCSQNRRGSMYRLRDVYNNALFQFHWSGHGCEFVASCPTCKYRGPWQVHDEPQTTPDKLGFERRSPKEIYLLHDLFSGDVEYLWQIPEDYKRDVRGGELFFLERVQKDILDAIRKNQLFKFAPDALFHMREPWLAGRRNRGLGVSRLLTTFRQAWYVQLLHRHNEAIALDYVIPTRIVTPSDRRGANGDMLNTMSMGDASAQIRRMLQRRRRDPGSIHTLGFPVEYTLLGAEANQLAPHELLAQGNEELLNAIGLPVELYKGTLQLQTWPVALRVFEATWFHLVTQNNRFLNWASQRIAEVLSWEAVKVRHLKVTHADDMQRHTVVMQMAMGGQVSMTTALRLLGLAYKDEQRNILEEARFQQEQQMEMQEEMEQTAFGQHVAKGGPPDAAAGGAAPAGGAAAGGAGTGQTAPIDPNTGQPVAAGPVASMIASDSMPQTPEEMISTAEGLAEQLLGMPPSQKNTELRALKDKNEVLHALVLEKINKRRYDTRMQGGMMLAQQQGMAI